MNINYINPFVTASIDIIKEITGLSLNAGPTYTKQMPYKSQDIVIMIGLTGMMRGNVAFSLSYRNACHIASVMMGGMSVTELDDMAKSAISELSNMISGNSAMILSNQGTIIDLTPPTVLTGENMQLSFHNANVVSVPLLLEQDEIIELDISHNLL